MIINHSLNFIFTILFCSMLDIGVFTAYALVEYAVVLLNIIFF